MWPVAPSHRQSQLLYHFGFGKFAFMNSKRKSHSFARLAWENSVHSKVSVGENKCISTRLNRHQPPRFGYFSLLYWYNARRFIIYSSLHMTLPLPFWDHVFELNIGLRLLNNRRMDWPQISYLVLLVCYLGASNSKCSNSAYLKMRFSTC